MPVVCSDNCPDGGHFGTPVHRIPGQNEFNQGGETDLAAFYGDVAGVTDGGSGGAEPAPRPLPGYSGTTTQLVIWMQV